MRKSPDNGPIYSDKINVFRDKLLVKKKVTIGNSMEMLKLEVKSKVDLKNTH